MGKTKRDRMKRRLAQSIHHLDSAATDLIMLHGMFEGVHDDYTEYLESIINCIVMSKEMSMNFWKHAWGTLPKDTNIWR